MLSGVVYRIKRIGPRIEPCGTPYESVTYLTDCPQFLRIGAYFASKKKTKFDPAQI